MEPTDCAIAEDKLEAKGRLTGLLERIPPKATGTIQFEVSRSCAGVFLKSRCEGLLFVFGCIAGTQPGERDPMPTFDNVLKQSDKWLNLPLPLVRC
jgi:hypothetical protein